MSFISMLLVIYSSAILRNIYLAFFFIIPICICGFLNNYKFQKTNEEKKDYKEIIPVVREKILLPVIVLLSFTVIIDTTTFLFFGLNLVSFRIYELSVLSIFICVATFVFKRIFTL